MNIYNCKYQHHRPAPFRSVSVTLLLLIFSLASVVQAAEFQQLVDTDVEQLQTKLDEMKTLAPQLRVQLRKVRSRVEFDVRQIHAIERSISQSEKDLERLILMHRGNRFNEMRAHFLADSLRRKSRNLHAGENYVMSMIEREQENPEPGKLELLEDYNQLQLQLASYNQLMDVCLSILNVQYEIK
ncbi:MAG: hypothetical protein JAY85_04595 [Candidatus Thiodiazotropha weberae]|uniref:Uncharacterized protein n=1 Tax=Candidatus Thiodiazotropha endoloripes TaxID=1818881 RepID=A0A1E2URF6_9GAMM|nr:hypothetical protein [Candidatus Thiodiazotropha endoloripes]MCG7897720.1 hypothetical protein [Candidatus Thiodiazotropha weberae]ODB86205.1 hypothetical protein A3195_11215 [Candidatus Thiodiazotropha endoloripes]ODB97323.1 hypothetical protein A3196_11460 [Candidatus Thiodiazotropha endoloripes]